MERQRVNQAAHPAGGAGSRVYLIGAGAIARHHAAAAARLAESVAIDLAVADPNPAALAAFGEQFLEARRFADAAAMLAEPARPDDIVVVAAPPFAHHDLAVAALASGRHVLCEKPLAMDGAEARVMLRAAKEHRRLLGCCSNRFLGLATTEKARRLVAAGELGPLYHGTFVHRQQRRRSGIEYQPETRWFLDRSRSGGGVLMDWGPYDITTLNHVLDPVRVDVLAAWTANPQTALDLLTGTVFDTEQHVGASLCFHRRDGSTVAVTYERAAATHGGERNAVELEGCTGAVSWEWLDWQGDGRVTVTRDRAGRAESETTVLGTGDGLFCHHRPLVYFFGRVHGQPGFALVDEQAVFNFLCLRAIYDAAERGTPQMVELEQVA